MRLDERTTSFFKGVAFTLAAISLIVIIQNPSYGLFKECDQEPTNNRIANTYMHANTLVKSNGLHPAVRVMPSIGVYVILKF